MFKQSKWGYKGRRVCYKKGQQRILSCLTRMPSLKLHPYVIAHLTSHISIFFLSATNARALTHILQETLRFKNKVSPYIGKTLTGVVEKTYLGGKLVWDNGKESNETLGRFV